jgi:methylated-DNA-[protein]-cysteine S-methyltransferase
MEKQQDAGLFSAIVAAPFGAVGVRSAAGLVLELVFLPPGSAPLAARDAVAELAARQVARYLEDPDCVFQLPLARPGTPFQRRVWDAISAIARGRTRTYGQLAGELGSAARAVGQACGANAFPLVIPCHRVMAAGRRLGGFAHHDDGASFHVGVKRWLLAHEGVLDGA